MQINFIYRSTKEMANLSVRMCFRLKSKVPKDGYKDVYETPRFRKLKRGRKEAIIISDETKAKNPERYIKDVVLIGKTNISTTLKFFKIDFPNNKLLDEQKIKEQELLTREIKNLRVALHTAAENTDPELLTTEWLQKFLKNYSNGENQKSKIPDTLIGVIDHYLEHKLHVDYRMNDPRTFRTYEREKRKINVIKKNILFYEQLNQQIKLTDINSQLRSNYVKLMKTQEGFKFTTVARDLSYIGKFARYAVDEGKELNFEYSSIRYQKTKSDKRDEELIKYPYLSFEKLAILKDLDVPQHLKKVRDWMMISTYTGQRNSDWVQFNADKIYTDNNGKWIDIIQDKESHKTKVPILPEVEEILEKNGGEFPKTISQQKFNQYAKEVCKLAGFNEIIYSNKFIVRSDGKKRKMDGYYKFYEVYSSHGCRRGFCSNFFGIIPTPIIMAISKHSSEALLRRYIQRGDDEVASSFFAHLPEQTVEKQIKDYLVSNYNYLTVNDIQVLTKQLLNVIQDKDQANNVLEKLTDDKIKNILNHHRQQLKLLLS